VKIKADEVLMMHSRIIAKNKGDMEMYLVDRIKPEYSADPAGKVPNNKFRKVYESRSNEV